MKAPTKRNKEKMEKYYTISNSPTTGDETAIITLRNCDYSQIQYRYSTVRVEELTDGIGGAKLAFSYMIVDDASKYIDDTHDFEIFIGDVLFHILINNRFVSGADIEKNRNTNSKSIST